MSVGAPSLTSGFQNTQKIQTTENSGYGFRGIAKKISLLAIPIIIGILILSSLPKAAAGPVTYKSCVAGCINLGGAPPLIAACIAACTFTLGPWCP